MTKQDIAPALEADAAPGETSPAAPAPAPSDEQEAERTAFLELIEGAIARSRAVAAFHELHPPHHGRDSIRATWSATVSLLDTWRDYASKAWRWYGTGWPHDEDRKRREVGAQLARALVDGTPPAR